MRNVLSILMISLLAIAAPAVAQQKAAGSDRAMAQAVAWQKHVADVFNTHSAASVAALYSADAVFVDPSGNAVTGRPAIEAVEVATFKAWGDFKFASTIKEARAIGNGVWFTFETTVDAKATNGPFIVRLHGLNVLVRQGKDWKIAVTSLGVNLPPPGASPQR